MASTKDEQPWTILRLLNWTKDYFERQRLDSPRLAAEVLLAHVLECPRVKLYAEFSRVPTEAQRSAYRELVRRAADHEPVAYLVGAKEFYSLSFEVTPAVLIPRPETELLVDAAVEQLKTVPGEPLAWDACTGSGCVAAAVAKHAPPARVLATDVSGEALAVAERNVARHGLCNRVTVAKADLLTPPADWHHEPKFHVITANPPYVTDSQMDALPAQVKREPASALAAGPDGLACIEPILRQAPGVLVDGGLLAIEIGFGQAEAVWDRLTSVTELVDGRFVKDINGIERVLTARKS